MSVVQQYEKYLSLQSFIGQKKKESFEKWEHQTKGVEEVARIEGETVISSSREVLIKAVAQALPTYSYTMSCFELPTGLCHDIEALIWIKKNGEKMGLLVG